MVVVGVSLPSYAAILQMRGGAKSPMLTSCGLSHLCLVNRVSSTVLPRQGTGPAFPSVTAGKGVRSSAS